MVYSIFKNEVVSPSRAETVSLTCLCPQCPEQSLAHCSSNKAICLQMLLSLEISVYYYSVLVF
jgi:cytochrome c-type biogenesis protein CcmH/NrfF